MVHFIQTVVLELALQHRLHSISKKRQSLIGLVYVSTGRRRSPKHIWLALPRDMPLALCIDCQVDNHAIHMPLITASFDRPCSENPFSAIR